jgi:patatin-like phospholipase/acyl hydrolase
MAKLIRILSIDGGGIRGMIPGQVLISLERKLRERSGKPDARIGDFFDFVAGTSTGGMQTCLYLCPESAENPDKPKYSAQDVMETFTEQGRIIFYSSAWKKIRTLGGILHHKYGSKWLEDILAYRLGDVRLSQLVKPCLIPAYEIEQRRAVFFTQQAARRNDMYDYLVRDVARATTAAPTYFKPKRMESVTGVPISLIDGGVFANNPALPAHSEVRTEFEGNPGSRDVALLSLGTGRITKVYPYKKALKWGEMGWTRPLLDIMMRGMSETVNHHLALWFMGAGCAHQYLRVNSELYFASPELDNVSEKNIIALRQEGTRMAEEFDNKLNAFVNLLLDCS